VGDYKLVSAREDDDHWELFNLASDRGEQHNLAAAEPDRVRDLAARWQQLQDEFTRNAGPVRPASKKPPGSNR
jgi:arylsulfatase